MRRRVGELLPIEQAILAGGIELAAAGEPGFYGFGIARQIRDASTARQLTAHGTLYKALARLERAGLLTSSWEDPDLAEAEGRPRRRLYRVTPTGEEAVVRSVGQRASAAPRYSGPRPGFVLAAQSRRGISGEQRLLTWSIAYIWPAALAISFLTVRLLPARPRGEQIDGRAA